MVDGERLTEIENEIADIAGHLNALYGRLVHVAAEVIDENLWHGIGYRSAAQWLGMRAGLAPERARSVIAAAERRTELPVTLAALAEGRLSIDQVGPVVRRVPAWAEAAVCQFALYGTVPQIRAVVTRYPFDPQPPSPSHPDAGDLDSDDPSAASGDDAGRTESDDHSGRTERARVDGATSDDGDRGADDGAGCGGSGGGGAGCGDGGGDGGGEGDGAAPSDRIENGPSRCDEFLSLIAELDGSWSLHGRLDADRGLELDAALRAAGDALRRRAGAGRETAGDDGSARAGDPESVDLDDGHRAGGAVDVEWSLVDAFAELVRRSLVSEDGSARHDRYRVYLHIDAEGSLTDPWHRLLPRSVARLVSCEADVRPVLSEGGVPIQAGRSRRRIDPDLRRMIFWRDQGCGVPGCGTHHRLDVHHIRHWLDGGPTDTSNLIAVCPAHHRMIHRDELSMSGNPDRPGSVRFWNRHGRAFGASPPRPPSTPPPPPASSYVHPTGESYQSWAVCFGLSPRQRDLVRQQL